MVSISGSEQIPGLRIFGQAAHKSAVIAFVMEGVAPMDIGMVLDREGIAVRIGQHCAQPLLRRLGVHATARASFGLYNTEEDVDFLIQHLPPIIRGEIRWCQGYSEPGAGSDLAGLQSRAVLQGDHFLVNAHKIWTSYSDVADWCFLLARTDPDVPWVQAVVSSAPNGRFARRLRPWLYAGFFFDEAFTRVAFAVSAVNLGQTDL